MRTEKKRSFKGAVLITVVSVMSLLIVFLTSTLILASAANNRAHKSYSSSQANYTARAAIDSILKAAKEDENFAMAMTSLSAGGGFDVNVTMEASATGIGRVDKARIEYAGKKQFYDSVKQEWVERDLISITADVTSGSETKTITAYVLKNPPTPGGGGGGGGGFVTVGTAGTANHTISFGGTYLGIGMSKGTRYYQGEYFLPGGQIVSLEDKFYLNRKDDKSGVIDTTTGLLLPNLPETTDADEIVTYSFGNEGSLEAPVVINGNLYANTKTEIYFPNKGSGLSVWGNMKFQNPDRFSLKGNTSINPTKFNEIPYIYVDSLFQANDTKLEFNTDGAFPLNMFCGSVDLRNANIGADVYCQDSRKTSVLSGDAATSLYKWSDSVINGSAYLNSAMSGNFYSKGNVIVKDSNNPVTINGDLVVEGNLEVTGKLNVTGSIVVGGTFIANSTDITYGAGQGIYANLATGSAITTTASKKMAPNGIDELYERHDDITYCVLAKDVTINHISWGNQEKFYNYMWLNPDVISSYSLPVGATFVDMNGGVVIDETFINEYVNNGIDASNETTVKKEYSVNTYWENVVDHTITTNEADTYEPGGSFTYNGSVAIGSPSLYADTHNHELFPRKAEKAVILGLEEIGDGTAIADSKVLKTVSEIEDEYNFSAKSITEIPSTGNFLADVNANVYDNNNLPTEITSSCTLSGTFDKDIIIKNTSTNDIWVKLDNFTLQNNGDIIYDDSTPNCGILNIFVENSADFLTGCSIYTKSYKEMIDNNEKFQIATDSSLYINDASIKRVECPKINICSKKIEYNPGDLTIESQPRFNMSNGASIVTAAIEAPNMKFDITNAKNLSGNEIYYNGRKINDAPGYNGSVGVIGILNVAEGSMQNEWVFLYTPRNTGGGGGGGGGGSADKEFDVMYYEGF
ncbi:MAG: hypothetical protein K2K14_04370 [Ruminococcus sp.]|nr:hypothetical protein [Ruminococcus sp.]